MSSLLLDQKTASQMQAQQAVMNMRLNLAGSILAQLAAIDFSSATQRAHDHNQTYGGTGDLSLELHTGHVGQISVAYADSLLIALGILQTQPGPG